ncbi:MAG: thioredoxin family protein [Bacteroidetes bacterium]|nr:thioredoxin family protein [Bacteroidota bacterium]MBU1371794.1 thioredoxin family protein [Bacteroidota bacterium]MBU1485381.1 thioredoxin family protein [Bacteroidota bacterium]MBU1760062.1 thioredoxin family protein [Bacteroidota bacterium]MBU2266652.1 thioredoxin family protein [Bacteroidota bacterium]
MSYEYYRNLIDTLLEVDKTTGLNHSAAMIHYTKMNVQRMKRLDKTIQLNDNFIDLSSRIEKTYTWLVITEAWCGDAAQIIPIIKKMSDASAGKIMLKFILRDEHLDIMDAHLTNGSRAIPKVIILDDQLNEVASWGPRPKTLQTLVIDWMKDTELTHEDWSEKVHAWYTKDKTQEIQNEIKSLFKSL